MTADYAPRYDLIIVEFVKSNPLAINGFLLTIRATSIWVMIENPFFRKFISLFGFLLYLIYIFIEWKHMETKNQTAIKFLCSLL